MPLIAGDDLLGKTLIGKKARIIWLATIDLLHCVVQKLEVTRL
jgi:hypothetical protein